MTLGRALSAGTALAIPLVPAIAHACPMCATREDPGFAKIIVVGVMVVSPYLVVGTVLWFLIKRLRNVGSMETPR